MPYVIVKLWPGKSEEQKYKLADQITESVVTTLGYGREAVSVAFEEIGATEWTEKVYRPDILGNLERSIKSQATSRTVAPAREDDR